MPFQPPDQRTRRPRRVDVSDERGQTTVLIIGFGIIVLLLCTVVFDASQAFVYRRALKSITDGASLAAANGVDTDAIYTGGVGDKVKLSRAQADAEVDTYVSQGGYQSVSCDVTGMSPDFSEVTVTCNGVVRLPIANSVSGGRAEIPVDAETTTQTFATL